MKIHKKTRDKIARLSIEIIEDFDWIQKNERDYDISFSIRELRKKKLEKNEIELEKITNRFTPDELTEQIDNEDFQALNTGGDYGNNEIER
jgi:hypothetical protein